MFSHNFLLKTVKYKLLLRSAKYITPHNRSYIFNNIRVTSKCYGCCQNYINTNSNSPLYLRNVLSAKKYYSTDKYIEDLLNKYKQKESNNINEIFPQPRVTLNELLSKTPNKIFDIIYKQTLITPKGGKRKTVLSNDWTCTYTFIWPEKMKFESSALSKRQAAEKAAAQAVQWLYENKHINQKGSPLYDKKVIDELQSSLNSRLSMNIGDNSADRLMRIWDDYQSEIKAIYEDTFAASKKKMCSIHSALHRDSTLEEDAEEFPEATTDTNPDMEDYKHIHPVFGRSVAPTKSFLSRRQRVLMEKFTEYEENLTPLPIDQYIGEIISTIEKSKVTVIVGAAGCGKSTRVPAAILRACGVETAAIVSEPRRVAAIGLARRVADELHENVGECIGYQVRLHSKLPRPGGGVLYCTSGVLLRRLQANPGLEGCSHVVIDEAHERDINTDITLLLLKRALDINQQLKLIVMSATLDTETFTRYFDSCPVIEVPGRSFPVTIYHLDDIQKKFKIKLPNTTENNAKEGKPQINCQEIMEVIKCIDEMQEEGAILVFLPGWAEIKQVKQLLEGVWSNSTLHMILPIHSRLSTAEQTRLFERSAAGVRRIVLATNIAETSLTVPDVVHVVDAGAQRENRLRETTGTASLETVWVSLAGARQRAGRAGRVQPGFCYRLYTKAKEEEFAPHTTPEILRIPLYQTALDCKSYAPVEKVEDFLSQLPQPPSERVVQLAVDDLIDLGALTRSQRLTRLGSLLAALALPPRLGAALLHAAALGGLLAAANVAVHCSDAVELFHNAADRREEIREIKSEFSKTSDHAALHWLQDTCEHKMATGRADLVAWCERYGLREDSLKYVKAISNLHVESLARLGALGRSPDAAELDRFSGVDELTAALLLSGTNCLLTTHRYVRTKGKLMTAHGVFTSKGERAHISSESVNYGVKKQPKNQLLTYFGGHHSRERRALVVYKTSLVSPHTAALFAAGDVSTEKSDDGNMTILHLQRHRLKIEMPDRDAEAILRTREMLWNTLKYYIERDESTMSYDELTNVGRFKTRLVKAIGRILVEAEKTESTIDLR